MEEPNKQVNKKNENGLKTRKQSMKMKKTRIKISRGSLLNNDLFRGFL